MPLARRLLIDPGRPGWVHCINRCVRQAFLTGGRFAHRRLWVEERLRELAGVFACEVAAYAVMSNHVHVIVRMDREAAWSWSDAEVATRWLAVFGKRVKRDADGSVAPEVIASFAANPAWITERRARLANLSWFMRALAEHIAVRANQEDETSGRFWDGRFRSVPLLDQAALVACMAYVDLNPVRAGVVDRPELAEGTSLVHRLRRTAPWLAPLERCLAAAINPSMRLTPDDYLTVVDLTGRMVARGRKARIPPELPAILERLDITASAWLATATGWRAMHGSAVGNRASRIAEAQRRGLRWVRNRCPLFAA